MVQMQDDRERGNEGNKKGTEQKKGMKRGQMKEKLDGNWRNYIRKAAEECMENQKNKIKSKKA